MVFTFASVRSGHLGYWSQVQTYAGADLKRVSTDVKEESDRNRKQ
jgi:hypothetical protein